MRKKLTTNVIFLCLCCGSILLFQGCSFAARQQDFRAYADDSPKWKVVENCGYENCEPMVDFLTSKDVTIRLEFDNDWQTKQFFVIRTGFKSINSQIEYSPALITVKLNNEVLRPKVFTCSYTPWDLTFLRSAQSLQGSVPVKVNSCYLLFFDYEQLSLNDEAEMNMNEAITSNSISLGIPLIHFRKNVALKKN